MSQTNQITLQISEKNLTEIKECIQTISVKLPPPQTKLILTFRSITNDYRGGVCLKKAGRMIFTLQGLLKRSPQTVRLLEIFL
jgi:hypothetical protein